MSVVSKRARLSEVRQSSAISGETQRLSGVRQRLSVVSKRARLCEVRHRARLSVERCRGCL